jgi:SCY1-like protein 1
MDAVEADGTIYIMTERVKPLSTELEATSVKDKQDWILWGLHRITVRCLLEWQLDANSPTI